MLLWGNASGERRGNSSKLVLGAIVLIVACFILVVVLPNSNLNPPTSRQFRKLSTAKHNSTNSARRNTLLSTQMHLTYLYIVGVEGVGHHGISPAIATIAKTCNSFVIYEPDRLRSSQRRKSSAAFQSQLKGLRTAPSIYRDIVVVEDASFPTGRLHRDSNHTLKKTVGNYDLEWTYDQLKMANASLKYLYLNRDFYRTVASHPEFDGGFQRHAQVLNDFIQYIHLEYQAVNRKEPGIWRQISYEWFTNMDMYNCTVIVSAIVDFMQWDHCDVEFACQNLAATVYKERRKEVVSEDFSYARTFNTTLSIPVLDISPQTHHRFTTVVSLRDPIHISQDIRRPLHPQKSSAAVWPPVYPTGKQSSAAQRDRSARLRASAASVDLLPTPHRVLNSVSMLYLIGLQGGDVSSVALVLRNVAQSAGYHVVYAHPQLHRTQRLMLSAPYKATLSSLYTTVYNGTDKVLVLLHDAYPVLPSMTKETYANMRRNGLYNLNWVWTQAQEVGITVKFLYLQRDLQQYTGHLSPQLAAAPVAQRAQILHDHALFIQEEYQRIEGKKAGLWAQVRYEWFAQIAAGTPITDGGVNCTSLVAALAQHAGWEGCDAGSICVSVNTSFVPGRVLPYSPSDVALLQAKDVVLSIPLLHVPGNAM